MKEATIKSFNKCQISNVIDGTDDDAVCEGSDNNSLDRIRMVTLMRRVIVL